MHDPSDIHYSIILATVFFLVLVAVVVTAILRYHNRKRAHGKTLAEFDHTLLQTRLEIQEQTCKTIFRELHDNLGQMLTLAKLNLNTLNPDNRDQSNEKINGAIDLITQTIQSIRELSRNLHADVIEKIGLIPALEYEVRLIEKLGILHPVFHVEGQQVPVTTDKSLIIFRIVQEALHNVVQHAHATILEMSIKFSLGQVRLTIADNGRGFNWNDNKNKGSGLRNMNERARVIGAQFDLRPAETNGTVITLTIPNT